MQTAPAENPLTVWPENPAERLDAVFDHIHRTRMHGIPILNEAIGVAAVGFREWEGRWLGVMVTPWFMNLMLLPKDPDRWQGQPEGEQRKLPLPSGDYAFVGGHEETIGEYLFCSLASPMRDFTSHAQALRIAGEVMDLVLQRTVEREPGQGVAVAEASAAAAPCGRESVDVARRGFFTASFEGLGRGRCR